MTEKKTPDQIEKQETITTEIKLFCDDTYSKISKMNPIVADENQSERNYKKILNDIHNEGLSQISKGLTQDEMQIVIKQMTVKYEGMFEQIKNETTKLNDRYNHNSSSALPSPVPN